MFDILEKAKQLSSQIECVRREIAMRKKVYPRLVAAGKKTAGSADFEIACMTETLNTLILARNAHLDKPFNQRPGWQKYPEHQPSPEQIYEEFLIAYINPFYVQKTGYDNRAPKYQMTIMAWMGNSFLNNKNFEIAYFHELPQFPKE